MGELPEPIPHVVHALPFAGRERLARRFPVRWYRLSIPSSTHLDDVNERETLAAVETAALEVIDEVRREGITEPELRKAANPLRARLVFDDESVTSMAHQLGYFETIASFEDCQEIWPRIKAVTLDDVARVASRYLGSSNRTVGWFEPTQPADR